jgi:glycosyltransferase involved in cell wall biosynthesis
LGAVFFTKGLDLLVDAFNLLPPVSAELHLYGPVVNQDYFREVMSRIKADRTVSYHGEYGSEQLPAILANTDITVIPSRMESFSLVTRESLHAKVPVIGPDIGGIPEVIQDGINGFLFRSGDYRDLADKLMILIRDPEKLNTLRNGIGPVRTIAEEVDDLESIYEDVLRRRGAPVGRSQKIGS